MHVPWSRSSVRIGLAVILVAGVITLTTSPAQLAAAAAALDLGNVAAAAALMPVGVLLQWWKWRALLLGARPEVGEAAVLRSLLAGLGLGLVTPGRLGELGRGVALPHLRAVATTLAVVDRMLSGAVTLLAGAVTVAAVSPGGFAGVCLFVAGGSAGAWWLRRRGRLDGVAALLAAVPWRNWGASVAGAVLFNLVFWCQLFLLVRAAGPVGPAVALAIPGVFALKTLLPVSFMDLGIREAAAVFVLGPVGVSPAVAVQAGLLLFALNVLVPGLAGLLVLLAGVPRLAMAGRPLASLVHVR